MSNRPQRGLLFGLSGSVAGADVTAMRAGQPTSGNWGDSAVRNVVMAVHGGAGSLPRGSITPKREKEYRDGLEKALRTGATLLAKGKSSLDAVEAAVRVLEDDPTFNAGKDYFFTQQRWDELINAKKSSQANAVVGIGTVGAVAVDGNRDVAAATSTGGLTNKLVGRVGDSPIIGAGTYANNRTLAVSCTGIGEVFIRGVAAYDISAIMEYTGAPVQRAAATVITEKIPALGATGGAIALDPKGVLATPHSTDTLINGYITRDGKVVTRIYDDETPPR